MQSTNTITAGRLRKECQHLGINEAGSRSELAQRLIQNGVHLIDTSRPPLNTDPVDMTKTTDISNVFIGPNAEASGTNKLCIANKPGKGLILGDFENKTITFNDCLCLENTDDLHADTPGEEGQLRRQGKDLFMYRSTGMCEGWYPIQFGPVRVV